MLRESLIYQIEVEKQREERAKKKKVIKPHWFVRACKWTYRKMPSLGAGAVMKENYRKAVDFLEWDLTPGELASFPKLVMMLSLVAALFSGYFAFFILQIEFTFKLYAVIASFMVPFAITVLIQNLPLREAANQRLIAITFIPEIVNYLVMSMKLTPNLERAVEFAAEHGRGKISREFKRMLWQTRVGVYKSIEDGIDELAYRWGEFSEEFKHAMMLVRSSVLESDDAKRASTLDKAVRDVLTGIKEKMDVYVRGMQQPSVYLYYFGVLLPLMLVIIVPIGSMIACLPLAQAPVLSAVYNLGVPLMAFMYSMSIVKKRPPTYIPPEIPDDFPGIPKRGMYLMGKSQVPITGLCTIIAVVTIIAGIIINIVLEPWTMPNTPLIGSIFPQAPYEYLETENPPQYLIFSILCSIAFTISFYWYASSKYKRKIQKDVMALETEFQDAMYVIASRLGENRPIEDAFQYVVEFLPQSKAADIIFRKSLENITMLGLNLDSALFHPTYGSLKNIPSSLIQGSMKILVDSVKLGVGMAAQSLMALSAQLRDQQKINETLNQMLADVTGMMKTMSIMITPLVLGISTALEKIVISSLGSIQMGSTSMPTAGTTTLPGGFGGLQGGLGLQGFLGCTDVLEQALTPASFLLIIGLFVLEICIVLIYFVAKISEGENELAFPMTVCKILPISMVLFCLAVVGANMMVGGFTGGK